jgi:plastocyanin
MAKVKVSIATMAFTPATVTIKVGDCVCWTNDDGSIHTATCDVTGPGSFDSGDIAPKASFDQAFPTAGTYNYHCKIHQMMKGIVTVS